VSPGVVHSCSEFFHLARKPIRDKTSPVGVPPVVVVDANPLSIWVAVLADVDGSRSVAGRVAAVVCHSWFVGVLHLEIAVHCVLVPFDSADFPLDHLPQTCGKVVT
jgi:hypothetical protein